MLPVAARFQVIKGTPIILAKWRARRGVRCRLSSLLVTHKGAIAMDGSFLSDSCSDWDINDFSSSSLTGQGSMRFLIASRSLPCPGSAAARTCCFNSSILNFEKAAAPANSGLDKGLDFFFPFPWGGGRTLAYKGVPPTGLIWKKSPTRMTSNPPNEASGSATSWALPEHLPSNDAEIIETSSMIKHRPLIFSPN